MLDKKTSWSELSKFDSKVIIDFYLAHYKSRFPNFLRWLDWMEENDDT